MIRIIHVPIEQYPNRYTADWLSQFEDYFKERNIDFITVLGEVLNDTIISGSVLDACGTHIYKFSQLNKIIRMINNKEITDEDVIFFADAWFPGLESLFYIRNITGINFKVVGIFHAGTWDPYDFTSRTGMRLWGQHVELGWIHGMDMIFVATQWHKDLLIMNSGQFDKSKIYVTGLPFYSEKLQLQHPIKVKENIVVFPHRVDEEKHPEKFDRLARKYPQWRFVKTIQATANRNEYFDLLSKSKVMISYAEQETFGYATLEAMALGNHVIVPDSLSYRETVPKENRYSNEKEIPEMLEAFMAAESLPVYPELAQWAGAFNSIIYFMGMHIKKASDNRKFQDALEREAQVKAEQARQDRKQKRAEAKKGV